MDLMLVTEGMKSIRVRRSAWGNIMREGLLLLLLLLLFSH